MAESWCVVSRHHADILVLGLQTLSATLPFECEGVPTAVSSHSVDWDKDLHHPADLSGQGHHVGELGDS